jgi:hypothetical protein
MREEFEEWAVSRGLSVVRYAGGAYVNDCTLWAEIAWYESRAALCVELPHIGDYIDTYKQGDNRDAYLADMRDAIQSTGIRVK